MFKVGKWYKSTWFKSFSGPRKILAVDKTGMRGTTKSVQGSLSTWEYAEGEFEECKPTIGERIYHAFFFGK